MTCFLNIPQGNIYQKCNLSTQPALICPGIQPEHPTITALQKQQSQSEFLYYNSVLTESSPMQILNTLKEANIQALEVTVLDNHFAKICTISELCNPRILSPSSLAIRLSPNQYMPHIREITNLQQFLPRLTSFNRASNWTNRPNPYLNKNC